MRFMKNVILIFISFISFFLISCTYISINNSYLYTYDDSGYAASETVDVNGQLIRNFDVDWPVGKVIVRSYDGEYIVIHESVSEVEDQYLMHTKVVDDSFFIRYLASGTNFKDIEEIRHASEEELSKVKGMSYNLTKRLVKYFKDH